MAVLEKEQATEKARVRPGREFRFRKGGPLWKAAGAGVGQKEASGAQSGTMATLLGVDATTSEATAYVQRKHTRGPSLKDGAEMLKQASDKALAEITDEAVSNMKEKAKKGDVVCVKTLLTFSEKKKPREAPKRRRRGKTEAEMLALAPQWEGPMDDEDANLGVPFGPLWKEPK